MTIFQFLFAARWIYFTSVFALFGSSLFWSVMGAKRTEGLPVARRATTVALRVVALLTAMSGVAWLAAILANMTGSFASLVDAATLRLFFGATAFGPVAIARLALLAAAALLACLPWRGRVWLAAVALVGAALLITQAWFGHAADGGSNAYGALMILVYCIHTLAAAAWVGSLPALFFALVELRTQQREANGRSLDLLMRYSAMALSAVTLILISGLANTAFRVHSLGALAESSYGTILFIKVGLVGIMLAIACLNRFVAMPNLAAGLPGSNELGKLRLSIGVELTLGVLVIGAAALLGITMPPR